MGIQSKIAEEYFKGDDFAIAEYLAKLVTQEQLRNWAGQLELEKRNKDWVGMLSSEEVDAQLVVVDNVHTWFKTGVLMLLKKKGWTIKQVDLNLKPALTPTRVQDEDLFKLSEKEFKDAIDLRANTLQKSLKQNK